MQRTGRKGHPMYRVIVQDSHRQPTSGRVVANLGSYNPHTKETTLDKEQAATFLKNGAQPSDRVVKLLQAEKVELPKWVKVTSDKKQKAIKNVEKLRRNRPEEEKVDATATEEVSESAEAEAPVVEEAERNTEQIAAAEVADGQKTAEEEVAQATEESEDDTPAKA